MTGPVVILTTNLAPGGAETQVAQLAIALRGRGWEVSVVSLLTPTAFIDDLSAHDVPLYSLHMRAGVPDAISARPSGAKTRRPTPSTSDAPA